MLRVLCAAITLVALAPSQSGKGQPPTKEAPGATTTKLTEWPNLKKAERTNARRKAGQFRKRDPKLHDKASKQLIAMGPSIAPVLIPMVSDRQDGINVHLLAVLDAVITPEHAALLAREVGRPSLELRRYLMRKLATFHDADIAPILKKALKDKDAEVAFYAGLGLLGVGQHDGLDVVMAQTRKRWDHWRPLIAQVLTPARSADTANPVYAKVVESRTTDQMAGLRLLRYLMVKEQSHLLRHFLQSKDFTVKRAAINTARVVHGEQPIEKLSSFQAIDMAKQWLDKL